MSEAESLLYGDPPHVHGVNDDPDIAFWPFLVPWLPKNM
jgi:hypothetical protein